MEKETPLNLSATPQPVVHPLKEESGDGKVFLLTIGIIVIIGAGIFTGYLLSQRGVSNRGGGKATSSQAKQVVGSEDTKTFRDSAEGVLEKGGLDGEGSHKLIRPGGESQTAYLTSSVVDLDQFVGKKVKVWGETFKAQKAGWLMDVGKIEVLEDD